MCFQSDEQKPLDQSSQGAGPCCIGGHLCYLSAAPRCGAGRASGGKPRLAWSTLLVAFRKQEAGDVANVGDHGVAIVRLKRWLLAGLEDASWPKHCQRQHHVSLGGKGLQAFEAGPSETELNETSAKLVSK